MTQRAAGLILLFLVAAISGADAQGAIQGVVRDSAGRPLVDAWIRVSPAERWRRSDSLGRFVMRELQPGRYAVRAQKLGYIPEETSVRVDSGPVEVALTLLVRIQTLDTVSVTAGCHRFQFEGFLCRSRGTKGVFLDEEAIDSSNPRFPQNVFRGMKGFRVIAVRGGLGVEALTGWRCVVMLANGRKPTLQNPLPRWPGDMIGVEAYADVNDVPAEYRQFVDPPNRCSLINYWTTLRPRYPAGTTAKSLPP